jgi:hypothetical protein
MAKAKLIEHGVQQTGTDLFLAILDGGLSCSVVQGSVAALAMSLIEGHCYAMDPAKFLDTTNELGTVHTIQY